MNIEITRSQGMFYLRHIIRSYMLSQGWGKHCDFYGVLFSVDEWEMLDEHIDMLELPSGYYDLCDMLGEPYGVGG